MLFTAEKAFNWKGIGSHQQGGRYQRQRCHQVGMLELLLTEQAWQPVGMMSMPVLLLAMKGFATGRLPFSACKSPSLGAICILT
eukprot:scaffold62068_cov15-Tisochrysis_lutea.AAC.1